MKKQFKNVLVEYKTLEEKENAVSYLISLGYKKSKAKLALREEGTSYLVGNSDGEFHTANTPKDFWIDKMGFDLIKIDSNFSK